MGLELKPGEDLHCSMDKKSTNIWLLEHTREDDSPYEIWLKEYDRVLAERRGREEFHVVGGMQFDTKRLVAKHEGKDRVMRKMEFVTHKVFNWNSDDEDQSSHEWHMYYLVFDEEDFIITMVKADPAVTPMAYSDAQRLNRALKAESDAGWEATRQHAERTGGWM